MHCVTVAYYVYQTFLILFVYLSLENVTMSVEEIETKVSERRTLKLRLKEIAKKISNAWSVDQQDSPRSTVQTRTPISIGDYQVPTVVNPDILLLDNSSYKTNRGNRWNHHHKA